MTARRETITTNVRTTTTTPLTTTTTEETTMPETTTRTPRERTPRPATANFDDVAPPGSPTIIPEDPQNAAKLADEDDEAVQDLGDATIPGGPVSMPKTGQAGQAGAAGLSTLIAGLALLLAKKKK
jgi:LPXTG-motif cell wall-anchored protein